MNWPYVVSIAVVAVAAIAFIIWAITAPVYRAWALNLPMAGGWDWPLALTWDAGCILVLCAFFWKVYSDAHAEMGETELRKPSVFGLRRIRWVDIVSVKRVAYGYHVCSNDTKIVLSPYAYKNPESVIQTLESRLGKNQTKAST